MQESSLLRSQGQHPSHSRASGVLRRMCYTASAMRRLRFALLLLCVGMAGHLLGCGPSAPTSITAWITPHDGRIPYTATIYCNAPEGFFTFELPDSTIGPQATSSLDVTVDSANWNAKVIWTDGETTLWDRVTATANNPRPTILGVRINGISNLWQLEPLERTLIEVIVDYGDDWRLTSIAVEGSASSAPFTVFYPPYEAGVCHASWNGWILENAAIVYPVYASIDTDGLPYTMSGIDVGYPTSYRSTNKLYDDWPATKEGKLEIPAQDGLITVTVEDKLGRSTTKVFAIPIQACDFFR